MPMAVTGENRLACFFIEAGHVFHWSINMAGSGAAPQLVGLGEAQVDMNAKPLDGSCPFA